MMIFMRWPLSEPSISMAVLQFSQRHDVADQRLQPHRFPAAPASIEAG